MSGKLELTIEDENTTPVITIEEEGTTPVITIEEESVIPVVNVEEENTSLVVNIEEESTIPVVNVEEENTILVVNIEDENPTLVFSIEDNPGFNGYIPLSGGIDNQLTRAEDGYYVPPTSWRDLRDKPESTTEEIDSAVSRSKQNASSIEGLEQSKVDKVVGKGLSSNDFTDTLRDKLEELEMFTTENKEALNELISGDYVWKEASW